MGNLTQWEEKAFKRWKKGKEFDKNLFRKSCTSLLELFYKFLATEYHQEQKGLFQLHQLWALNDLGADKYFESFLKRISKGQTKGKEEFGEEDFWIDSQLLNTQITYAHLLPQREKVPEISQAASALDQYYLLRRLKYEIAMQGQKQMLGSDPLEETHFFSTLMDQMGEWQGDWHPLIRGYHFLLMAYRDEENESNYAKLIELLQHGLGQANLDEQRELFTGTLNFCRLQMDNGGKNFDEEYGEIYQIMIDRDVIWYQGKILAWHVKNLAIYHLKRENYSWITNFVEQCQHKLMPTQQDQVILFCTGLSEYHQKKYKLAREYFEQLLSEFDDVFYGIDVRVAKARLLYETEDSELEQLLDSAPRFIRSKPLSQVHKTRKLNFFRYLKRLVYAPNEKKLHQLLQEV